MCIAKVFQEFLKQFCAFSFFLSFSVFAYFYHKKIITQSFDYESKLEIIFTKVLKLELRREHGVSMTTTGTIDAGDQVQAWSRASLSGTFSPTAIQALHLCSCRSWNKSGNDSEPCVYRRDCIKQMQGAYIIPQVCRGYNDVSFGLDDIVTAIDTTQEPTLDITVPTMLYIQKMLTVIMLSRHDFLHIVHKNLKNTEIKQLS